MLLPTMIVTRLDPTIEGQDKLFMDLFESICDISCQFRAYDIRMVCIIQIQ
jgi:hypothetical protein